MKNNSTSEPGLPALQVLQRNYGAMLVCPDGLASIPEHQYLVYILESDDGVIAVGHGKANRARVIFDSSESITRGHLKALFVRLNQLFAKPSTRFGRYLVSCSSKSAAQKLEKEIHALIGGNKRKLPLAIENALFKGFAPHSIPWLLLQQAVASSYDGLSDLESWNKKGLIKPDDWKTICGRLQLGRVVSNRKTK
ncbi:MAG: hypothetical protein RL077_4739 [Verrucomicrobiota bacterium]|jgi:hypothetical protein